MKTKVTRDEQMAMAALLPGMQYMIGLMQAQIDELRSMLAAAERAESIGPNRGHGRRGDRPRNAADLST